MNKKKRISIIFVLMLFLFSVFKITEALTSESLLQITNVEILNKSDTVEIIDVDFSKNAVQPKVVHHKIGDTITYKIHIKNKENKNYTIKSIKDNNTNEYISYEYENYEGFKINPQEEFSINIKETYQKEVTDITKRNQTFSIVFTIILEDENNNVEEQQINFNDSARLRTGEYLNLYVVSAVLSFVMLLIFLIKRKSYHYKYEKISLLKNLVKKYITLFSLVFLATLNIVPIISNDIDLESFDFAFQSSINLNDKLIVSYEIDGTPTDLVVDYNKRVELPPDPQKTRYDFNKWILEDGTEFDVNTPITKDIKLKADFIPTKYYISYELNGGTLPANYPTQYDIETENFILKNPTKKGYEFTGWTGSNGDVPQTEVTIQKGSTEDKTYTAHWNKITYNITYNLDGGTLPDGYPTSYTIESETFTLNNPTKDYYNFTGWTEENGPQVPQITVTIPKGSTGNKNYTAHWEPITYNITYDLDGGTLPTGYPTSYNVETETFTLNNPTKEGYTFTGWTGSNGDQPQTEVTIQKGSTGNREYTANWEPITYTITYNLDGGTLPDGYPISYSIETNNFTLNNPTKDGYEFTGWTGTDLQTKTKNVTISQGSTGNRTYTAHWAQEVYSITYNNIEGATIDPANPEEYDVEDKITLTQPTKERYNFTGWTGSNGNVPQTEVTISQGSTGNKEYTAHWEPITYTITYNNIDGATTDPANPEEYDVEDEITLTQPTKEGYTFTGWTGSNGTVSQTTVTISKSSTGNKTYTAHWTAIDYTITLNLDGGQLKPGCDRESDYEDSENGNKKISYTVETDNFNLPALKKNGYKFKGWTASNGETPQPTVTIPQGSFGDKTYTANWTDEYTIIFHSNPGQGGQDETHSQTVKFDQEVQLEENTFTNGDMEFKEWTTNSDGSGVKYLDKAINKVGVADLKIVNLPVDENLEVHLYTQWQEPNLTKTTFDKGVNVNKVMKQLAGNASATATSEDSNIRSIKRATINEYKTASDAGKEMKTVHSTYSSSTFENYHDCPIYMWFVKDDENATTGTIYYYSKVGEDDTESNVEASKKAIIYLNETSSQLFYNLKNLTSIDLDGIDSRLVKDAKSMFSNCTSITNIDLSTFNTSKFENMESMFSGCSNLTSLDLSNFNTCQVNNMRNMFSGCENLQILNVSNFNTFSVTSTYNKIKFNNPSYPTINNFPALKKLNLTNFDAGNVTDMSRMFYGLPELEELNLTNFKTTNATNMASMFAQCTKLKKLDLSSFDTSNVINMGSMFNNCASLTELDISSFNTSEVTDMNRMFASCKTLTELDVSSFNTSNVTNMQKMFSDMKNIETIYASDNFVTTSANATQMFVYDTNNANADQPNAKLTGGQGTTYDKTHLGKDYARIDDPDNGNPGYFTRKTANGNP